MSEAAEVVEAAKVETSGHEAASDHAKEIAALKQEAAQRRVKADELQKKLDEIQGVQTAAQEAAAIKNGEAAQLLEAQKKVLEGLRAESDGYKSALESYLETELEGVSDDLKALIPEGNIAAKLTWLNKAKAAGILKAKSIANGVMDSGEEKDNSGTYAAEIKAATTQAELEAVMKKHGKM